MVIPTSPMQRTIQGDNPIEKPDFLSQPILILGKDGQLGKSLQKLFSDLLIPGIFVGRQECDLSEEYSLIELLKSHQPKVIINAAAYTAVDQAEKESVLAYQINEKAVRVMADYIAGLKQGILVHFSTDYVFDGLQKTPYQETDDVRPISVYGASKLAGEQAIQESFKKISISSHSNSKTILETPRFYILRTSWVYGEGKNFIRTMINLASTKEALRVITDQIGCPTSSDWLAQIALQFVHLKPPSGIYHAVPDGQTSWHGLSLFAIETARKAGVAIKVQPDHIFPIPATEYPLPAPRPYNSRMSNQKLKDTFGTIIKNDTFPHWEQQVKDYVDILVTTSVKE